MRFYNVASPELNELATLSGFTTLFIALGSLSLGVTWDVWFALASAGIGEAAAPFMRVVRSGALLSTVLFYGIALVLFFRQNGRAKEIKNQTKFD